MQKNKMLCNIIASIAASSRVRHQDILQKFAELPETCNSLCSFRNSPPTEKKTQQGNFIIRLGSDVWQCENFLRVFCSL